MLAGHFAPAFALHRLEPRVPLWSLFLATQAVDFGFFALVFAGVESGSLHPGEHPRFVVTQGIWTHSLTMTAAYFGAIAVGGRVLGYGREGLVLAAAVASHWLADLIVHVPDLPVAFDQSNAVGAGLWRVPGASWVLECALLVSAAAWLQRRPGARSSRIWTLVATLCVLQTLSEFVIPLPPSDVQMGLSAWAFYLVAAAGAWWATRPNHPTGRSTSGPTLERRQIER